jgi:outer membrane murein-binding lipoprotein Lpp
MKLTLLIALAAGVLLASGCSTAQKDQSKWDYTLVSATDPLKTQKVNQLAAEGWEMADYDPAKGLLFKRLKRAP